MPVRIKPTPLTAEQSLEWAALAQQRFLDALMSDPSLRCHGVCHGAGIAFHGGTSLHLSWRSPRFSEDLDFLLAEGVDVDAAIRRATRHVQEAFFADDPDFLIEVKDRTRDSDRMVVAHLLVSNAKVLGKAMIKAEFWRVDPAYLASYPVEFRTPVRPGDMVSRVSNPVPAAALETAYCDKLTAFATRPFLKWRDIYDLWWIGTQTEAALDLEAVRRQFLHNVSAYQTIDHLPPGQALLRFLENDPEEIFNRAEQDLKRWLPPQLWAALYPEGVREMVRYTFAALKAIGDTSPAAAAMPANLKRLRP